MTMLRNSWLVVAVFLICTIKGVITSDVINGRIYFEPGSFTPSGCTINGGRRINFGETVDSDGLRFACSMQGNTASFGCIGCLDGDRLVNTSSTWTRGNTAYMCHILDGHCQISLVSPQMQTFGKWQTNSLQTINSVEHWHTFSQSMSGPQCIDQFQECAKYYQQCQELSVQAVCPKTCGLCQGTGCRVDDCNYKIGERVEIQGIQYECTESGLSATTSLQIPCTNSHSFVDTYFKYSCTPGKSAQAIGCSPYRNGSYVIRFGESYYEKGAYSYECKIVNGVPVYQTMKCAGFSGRMLNINETMEGPDGSYIRCAVEQGQVVRIIQAAPTSVITRNMYVVGDIVYMTKYVGGKRTAVPVGCAVGNSENDMVLFGKTIDKNRIRYSCSLVGGIVTLRGIGCLVGGRLLKNNQVGVVGHTTYQCMVTPESCRLITITTSSGITMRKAVGCVMKSGKTVFPNEFIVKKNIVYMCKRSLYGFFFEATGCKFGDRMMKMSEFVRTRRGFIALCKYFGQNIVELIIIKRAECLFDGNRYYSEQDFVTPAGSVFFCENGHFAKIGCKIGEEMIPIMNGENDLQYVDGYPYYCPKRVDKVVRLPIAGCAVNGRTINVGEIVVENNVAIQCRWKWLHSTSTVSYPTAVGCKQGPYIHALNEVFEQNGQNMMCYFCDFMYQICPAHVVCQRGCQSKPLPGGRIVWSSIITLPSGATIRNRIVYNQDHSPAGCSFDGKMMVRFGHTYDIAGLRYSCKIQRNTPSFGCIGCIDGVRLVMTTSTFGSGTSMYMCHISNNECKLSPISSTQGRDQWIPSPWNKWHHYTQGLIGPQCIDRVIECSLYVQQCNQPSVRAVCPQTCGLCHKRGCEINGEVYPIGERWRIQGVIYECTTSGLIAVSSHTEICTESKEYIDTYFKYVCVPNRSPKPVACSPNLNGQPLIEFGNTYTDKGAYVYECKMSPSGIPSYQSIGCIGFNNEVLRAEQIGTGPDGSQVICNIEKGRLVRYIHAAPITTTGIPGQNTFVVGDVVYKTQNVNGRRTNVPVGCAVGQNSNEIAFFGETINKNGIRYRCSLNQGVVTLQGIGCVINSGLLRNGQTGFQGSVQVYCMVTPEVCQLIILKTSTGDTVRTAVGCVTRMGRTVLPGQYITKNTTVLQCTRGPYGFYFKPVGCKFGGRTLKLSEYVRMNDGNIALCKYYGNNIVELIIIKRARCMYIGQAYISGEDFVSPAGSVFFCENGHFAKIGCKIGSEVIPIMDGENDVQYVGEYPYYCPKRIDIVIRLPITGCTIDGRNVRIGTVVVANGVAIQCRWKWLDQTSTITYPTVIGCQLGRSIYPKYEVFTQNGRNVMCYFCDYTYQICPANVVCERDCQERPLIGGRIPGSYRGPPPEKVTINLTINTVHGKPMSFSQTLSDVITISSRWHGPRDTRSPPNFMNLLPNEICLALSPACLNSIRKKTIDDLTTAGLDENIAVKVRNFVSDAGHMQVFSTFQQFQNWTNRVTYLRRNTRNGVTDGIVMIDNIVTINRSPNCGQLMQRCQQNSYDCEQFLRQCAQCSDLEQKCEGCGSVLLIKLVEYLCPETCGTGILSVPEVARLARQFSTQAACQTP